VPEKIESAEIQPSGARRFARRCFAPKNTPAASCCAATERREPMDKRACSSDRM